MKVDLGGYFTSIGEAGESARLAEAGGYDGWIAPETKADAFLSSAIAAERTERIEVATGIVVAFARNPMTVALQANDVQTLSGGRFSLGLGSQIKPHIEKRYSMPWSSPAARMREFILAIRAIWNTWETGEQLDFRGDFYTHSLMTPFFDPGPNPFGNPRIMLAAVGPLMTEVAGETADGILCHHFGTEKYVREHTLPALRRGAEKAGRSLEDFEIVVPSFVVAHDDEAERERLVAELRGKIGFYGSTPAYRPVLEAHGWGDLQDELFKLSKSGGWDRMPALLDDEIVRTIAVIGTPEEAIDELITRYGDIGARVTLALPGDLDPDRRNALFDRLRAAAPAVVAR